MLAKISDAIAATYAAPKQTERWFALVARPQKEQDAADWLRRERIPAYWPNYPWLASMTSKTNGRLRRRMRLLAVIPGYLFIEDQPDKPEFDLHTIVKHTPGLSGFVRDHQGEWATLKNDHIEVIRQIEGRLNLPPPIKAMHTFKMGQKVHFKDDVIGCFPPGKIGRLLPDGRIIVDTHALGRVVPVTVFPHQIEAM